MIYIGRWEVNNMPEIYFYVDGELSNIIPSEDIRLSAGIEFVDKLSRNEYLVLIVEASDVVAKVYTTKIN